MASWQADYNLNRPHARLGWLTPAEYADTFNPRRDLRCAQWPAPRQPPSLTPPRSAKPTVRVYVTLDRSWGQRHGDCRPSASRQPAR
ncbi:hypothetical protein [Nitrobacter sp. JJSN]|uniref:hypothetical protein n=1 Tax=Nitrobacter sp. JJSN TaxID=3453033 RepID=UPI003F757618